MDFIFYLPVWQGLAILIIGANICSIPVVWAMNKLIANKLNKRHERVGRLLFRVTASLVAFLISLSYANERVEHNRVRDSLEVEASLIANAYVKLGMHNSEEANIIRGELIKYVDNTIADNWEGANENPYFSSITESIFKISALTYKLPANSKEQTLLKNAIIKEVNEITKLMQMRFYAKKVLLPYIVYIIGSGVLIMWIFFAVYGFEKLSMIYLMLYNSFLVVLVYFLIMMSNPLTGTLKIKADAFIVLKTKGFDKAITQ